MTRLLLPLLAAIGLAAACTDPDPPAGPGDPIDVPGEVASIDITAPTSTLDPGTSMQLTATTRDADGAPLGGRPIVWATSDDAVVTVSSTGLVTAHAAGIAQIAAESDGVTGTFTLAVRELPAFVAYVTIEPSGELSLAPGATAQITATAYDRDGAVLLGRIVTWSSSDESVATVSDAGVVTARAAGDVWIRAVIDSQRDDLRVNVVVPVARVELEDGAALTLAPGATHSLSVLARAADDSVLEDRIISWSVDHAEVASIDSSGTVTAHAPGTAVVRAEIEGHSAQITITVLDTTVDHVDINQSALTLVAGDHVQLVATPRNAANEAVAAPVTWISNRPGIAAVDAQGWVRAMAPGIVVITAHSGGKIATALITVSTVTQRDLVTVNGGALPTTLFEYTGTVLGVEHVYRFDAHGGLLAVVDQTGQYELLVWGELQTDDSEPTWNVLDMTGTMTWDAAQERFVFTPDSAHHAAFTGIELENGSMQLQWQAMPNTASATLVFEIDSSPYYP